MALTKEEYGVNDIDKIKQLLEKFLKRSEEDKNKERKSKWLKLFDDGIDQWRVVPKEQYGERAPIVIDLQMNAWRKLLGFSLEKYYKDPLVFLKNYLLIQLRRYDLFSDDYYLSPNIRLHMGAPFEVTLLGGKAVFSEYEDPWIDPVPILDSKDDIKRLAESNALSEGFQNEDLMPLARNMYEGVKEIIAQCGFEANFSVLFPLWTRGPFGIATYLAGYENVLIRMVTDSEFAHLLMRIITEARKAWYLHTFGQDGIYQHGGYLFNDEVNCPSLSAKLYSEFILPYEKELCDFHGGISYWHSCGDVTKLLIAISEIPEIEMLHVGPWTNVKEAARLFGSRSKLEICPNPESKILQASPEEIKDYLNDVVQICKEEKVKGYTIRAGGLMFRDAEGEVLEKIHTWNRIAIKSLRGECLYDR